jgi:adenosine deaminase
MKRKDIALLPKVELHTHIDCALSYAAVKELRPDTSLDEYRERFRAPGRCDGLTEFLACIDPSLDLMQTKAALALAAADIADQLAADNVLYGEVRFAPLLHCAQGLCAEDVVEAVLRGLEGAKTSLGLLLCTLRHFDTRQGMATLDLVRRYSNSGVVGMDLAANESLPIAPHVPVFQRAKEAGISLTAHAGEAMGADSVIETLTLLAPRRIGHGVRSIEDCHAVEMLVENRVHLEVCPSTNVQVGVFPNIEAHSIERLRLAGVSVGINTDARTTTNVSLNDEYQVVADVFGWDEEQFRQANLAALDASFAPEITKQKVRQAILGGVGQSS